MAADHKSIVLQLFCNGKATAPIAQLCSSPSRTSASAPGNTKTSGELGGGLWAWHPVITALPATECAHTQTANQRRHVEAKEFCPGTVQHPGSPNTGFPNYGLIHYIRLRLWRLTTRPYWAWRREVPR